MDMAAAWTTDTAELEARWAASLVVTGCGWMIDTPNSTRACLSTERAVTAALKDAK